jgi:tetratricopeptide (TPR) repeat protein
VASGSPILLPPRYEPTANAIGHGGFGTVYRTVDRELGIPVAIKVPHGSGSLEERVREMTAELQASARLRHPGIVQVLDAGEDPLGRPWMAMEFADQGSIEQWIEDGPPAWGTLRRVLLELLDAIGYAHARGLIHRDIKPQNVLLARGQDGRLHPRLADFGLAKIRQDQGDYRSTRLVAGTLLYMAPETFEATSASIHPTADLYAFGVLLYCLLSPLPPWAGTGLSLVLEKTQKAHRPLELRSNYACPGALPQLVDALLHSDSVARPQLAADVRQALLGLGEERPATGPVPLAGTPPEPTIRDFQATPPIALHREPLFVGRAAHREGLWEAVGRVADRAIGACLLGPPGSGRSRLCSWLGRTLEESGEALTFHLLLDRSDSLGVALVRSVRRFLGLGRLSGTQLEGRTRARAGALRLDGRDTTELLSWLAPDEGGQTGGQPGAMRLGLFLTILHAASKRGRVVVWLEDRGGAGGAELASGLLRVARLDEVPVLVLYEPRGHVEQAPEGFDAVRLEPLTDEETLTILQDLVPFASRLDGEALLARGNPQRAVETARLIATQWSSRPEVTPSDAGEAEHAEATTDSSHWEQTLDLGVTRDLARLGHQRVAAFLEGGEREARQTLTSLLVLLPRPCARVDLEVAWRELGCDEVQLQRALDASLVAGLTRHTDAGEFDLLGAVVEQAASAVLDASARPELLARACATAVLVAADPGRRLDGARLLSRAGEWTEAAREAVAAGRALEVQDAVAARAAWELALDSLRQAGIEPPERRFVSVLLGLARLLRGTGELVESVRLLEEIQPDELTPTDRAEWYEVRSALHLLLGDAGEAVDAARAARALHEDLGRLDGESRALLLEAESLRKRGQLTDALPLFDRAVALAGQNGLEREELGARWRRAGALLWGCQRQPELRTQVRTDLEKALELARELRAGNFEGFVLRGLGNLAVLEGRAEEAEELLRRSVDQLRRCGLDGEAATTRISLGELARARGDLDAARKEYSIALSVTRAFGITQESVVALINLAIAELAGDRLSSAARRVREIDLLLPPGRPYLHRVLVEAVRLAVQVGKGRFAEAEETFEEVAELLEQPRPDRDIMEILEQAAASCQEADQLSLAADLWDLARQQAEALQDADAIQRLSERARATLG